RCGQPVRQPERRRGRLREGGRGAGPPPGLLEVPQVGVISDYAPASATLGAAVARAAQREATQMFLVRAAEIFSTLQTAARNEVAKLEALPKGPPWVVGGG